MRKTVISITAVLLGLCLTGTAGMVTDLSANAVAYYSFDNSGDLGHDDSGNGYNLATKFSAPAYDAAGRSGGACITATNAGWNIPGSSVLTGSAFTVAVYAKASAADIGTEGTGHLGRVLMPDSGATGDGLQIYINLNEWRDILYIDGSLTAFQDANTPAVADEWIHLAVTFTPTSTNGAVYTGTLRQYVNGVLAKTTSNATYRPSTASSYVIGCDSAPYAFKGAVDEMYFFDGALTESEIGQLSAVPEPAPATLLIIGAAGLMFIRRSMRK